MLIKEIVVTGDSGIDYTLRADVAGVTCECPAFKFSNDASCKHIRYVQARVVPAPALESVTLKVTQ